ncbi:MAG: hypothetical protein Tsb0019_24820 [Roseibium sp.]
MVSPEQVEREQRLTRIRQLSNAMKVVVTVILVLISVISALLFLLLLLPAVLDVSTGTLALTGVDRMLDDVPVLQRLGLAAVVALAFWLLCRIFWNVRQLFCRFSEGAFFTPGTQAHILKVGTWLLAYGVFDVLSDPIGSVLLTMDNAPGERRLELELSGSEFFFLIFGALMIVFGWIMREAASIAEENRHFV